MECPDCGLDVLVVDGKVAAHQRPDNLEPCTPKASKPIDEQHEPKQDSPAPKAPAKAPAKKTTKPTTKPATKTSKH